MNSIAKRCLAEFIGTFGLVFAGAGAIMVDGISGGQVTHLGVALTFGLMVAAMIYALGHVSGAHINPAVTLAFSIAKHFPLKDVPFYWTAQVLGAIAAALFLRLFLGDVAQIGATVPSGAEWRSFGIEIALTFFLMLVIMAVATDVRAVGQAAALAIGSTVALEAIFAGPITGASMNPARSIGPALVAGVGQSQWIYIVAPSAGAVLAALVYPLFKDKNGSGEKSPDKSEARVPR